MRNIEIFTLALIMGWLVLDSFGCGLKTTESDDTGSTVLGCAAQNACQGADGCCPAGCTFQNDSDCSRSCGNGQIEQNETCDPKESCPAAASCNDGNACTADSLIGSSASCNAKCLNAPISACAAGDGCCPSGCTSANDSDCGNNTPTPGGYPAGPYGTSKGSTLDNFKSYEPICSASPLGEEDFFLQEYVGAKAVLIIVSAGTCSECKTQAATVQSGFQDRYGSRGLKIVYVLMNDDQGNSGRQTLENYCCKFANDYGMSGFPVVADPAGYNTGKLFPSAQKDVPLTIVLDGQMKVQYYQAGTVPNNATVQGAIEPLL